MQESEQRSLDAHGIDMYADVKKRGLRPTDVETAMTDGGSVGSSPLSERRSKAIKDSMAVLEDSVPSFHESDGSTMTPSQDTPELMSLDVVMGEERPRLSVTGEGLPRTKVLGFISVFVSTLFFSLVSVLIKCDRMPSGRVVSTVEIAIFRAAAGLVFTVSGLRGRGLAILPDYLDRRTIWIALLRGALDFLASNCFYFACAKLPISVATVVYFTNPFWAGVLSRIFLHEEFGGRRVLLTLLAVLGVVISVFPDLGRDVSDKRIPVSSLIAALCGSFLQAGQYVAGRIITSNGIHWLHANLGYSIAGLCIAPGLLMASVALGEEVVSPLMWSTRVWTITTLIASFALLAQASLILGVGVLEAAVTAVVRTLDIPLAMCWAYLLLSEVPEFSQILGGGVLVVACALFAVGSGEKSPPGTYLSSRVILFSEGLLENQLHSDTKKKVWSNPQGGDR
jgi:drug/metabolite transporter (DMT)-like permease